MAKPHFLVTTDFSPTSLRALAVAAELLQRTGGRATLLHVDQAVGAIPHGAPFAPPISDPSTEPDPRGAMARLRQLVPELGDARVDTVVLHSQAVAPSIVDWAKRHKVDMIIIASRGHTAVADILLGSTAKAVLRKSDVPVLLCPAKPVARKG